MSAEFFAKHKYSKLKNVQDVHSWVPFPFMQDLALCKKLLLLVLADTIGTILLADLKGSSADASPLGKKLKDKSPNVPTLCITGTANGFI